MSDIAFSLGIVAVYVVMAIAAVAVSEERGRRKRALAGATPAKTTPWFVILEAKLKERKLKASVVIDFTPMHLRVRLKRHVAVLDDALGSRPEPRVALALVRLRNHGPIAIEEGELVTVLDRQLVDAWDASGHAQYADDVAAIAEALTKAKPKTKVRAPPPTEPLPPLVDEDSPEPEGEGAPSGAPVAVRFQK